MKPIVKISNKNETVELIDGNDHITLRMEAVDAIFEALMESGEEEITNDAEGVIYPVGIGATPKEGELRVMVTLEDGTEHVFAFRAPGKSIDHVRGAADSLQECFQRLFAQQ